MFRPTLPKLAGRKSSPVVPFDDDFSAVTPTDSKRRITSMPSTRGMSCMKKLANRLRHMNSRASDATTASTEDTVMDSESDSESIAYECTNEDRSESEPEQWAIRVHAPEEETSPADFLQGCRLDGDWVLVNADEDIADWLFALLISGEDVIDANGDHCEIVPGPRGPYLCGGVLRRHGDRLIRYGKTGRMQEFRRRGHFLSV